MEREPRVRGRHGAPLVHAALLPIAAGSANGRRSSRSLSRSPPRPPFEPRPPRARARSGATTAALLVAASAVAAALPAPIDPPSGDRIRVVAWNVHQAFGNRGALDPEIYAEVLRDLDADIIMLQESDGDRSAQVQELLHDAHEAPHILGGDLNLCAPASASGARRRPT